jgi:hypothetical protein
MIQMIPFLAQANLAAIVPVDFPADDARPWLVQIGLGEPRRGKIRAARGERRRGKAQERLS